MFWCPRKLFPFQAQKLTIALLEVSLESHAERAGRCHAHLLVRLWAVICGCCFAPREVGLRSTPCILCRTAVGVRAPGLPGVPASVARSLWSQGVGPVRVVQPGGDTIVCQVAEDVTLV